MSFRESNDSGDVRNGPSSGTSSAASPRWFSRPLWPHFLGAAWLLTLIVFLLIATKVVPW